MEMDEESGRLFFCFFFWRSLPALVMQMRGLRVNNERLGQRTITTVLMLMMPAAYRCVCISWIVPRASKYFHGRRLQAIDFPLGWFRSFITD